MFLCKIVTSGPLWKETTLLEKWIFLGDLEFPESEENVGKWMKMMS